MKILIICTYFPPDSTIGAIRPFMFAKYLSMEGHDVTVIRSGEFGCVPDDSYGNYDGLFKVISYLGYNSSAERYKRGQFNERELQGESKVKWLPKPIKDACKKMTIPISGISRIRLAKRKLKASIATINTLQNDSFDLVFSTYGDLENIWAGWYASEKQNAKLIQDFRDPIVWYFDSKQIIWNLYASYIQKKALMRANMITTVSEGLRNLFLRSCPDKVIKTIYNGFEEVSQEELSHSIDVEHLSICYLGKIYEESAHALDIFFAALSQLNDEGSVDKRKIRFVYAGNDEKSVNEIVNKYNMECVLDNKGYVDRNTAREIQMQSDLFLVLSWNTKASQGVLTGKFYEGIRARKPILSIVVGNEPNSELRLINEKYHYGYCYEESSQKTEYNVFLEFIKACYKMKERNGRIVYEQNEELTRKFRYDILTKELESIMWSLVDSDGESAL